MLKVDLHTHTVYSTHPFYGSIMADGLNTPEEMVNRAKKVGLDAINISDHNRALGIDKAKRLSRKYRIEVLSGAEIKVNGKDTLAVNIDTVPKFGSLQELKEKVNEEGGILIAPHPNDILGRGYRDETHFDAIECLNGYHAKIYHSKTGKPEVAGSDSHWEFMLGYAYTVIEDDDVIEGILRGYCTPYGRSTPKHIIYRYYFKKFIMGGGIHAKGKRTYDDS